VTRSPRRRRTPHSSMTIDAMTRRLRPNAMIRSWRAQGRVAVTATSHRARSGSSGLSPLCTYEGAVRPCLSGPCRSRRRGRAEAGGRR
jgi:hypothetical protein